MNTAGAPVLVIDAGNTHVHAALMYGTRIARQQRFAHGSMPDWVDRLAAWAGLDADWQGAALASVVPALNEPLLGLCQRLTGNTPLVVSHRTDLGIRIATAAPEQVGADRLATAAGAYLAYGGPLIVVDMGTAVTTSVVTADGRYLGGAIAPGPQMALDALVSSTAQLPLIQLQAPPLAIGDTTVTAMQAGMVWGFAGLVERLIEQGVGVLSAEEVPQVLLTGGASGLFTDHLRVRHRLLPDLTLQGLGRIFARAQ